jgi:hypothetical protein
MSVACTIGMAELQHDGKCKNDYKSGAIVFTGGTGKNVHFPGQLGDFHLLNTILMNL